MTSLNINKGIYDLSGKNISWGCYTLAVWRFKPILIACLRVYSHLPGGLRLKNYCPAAGNHKFSSRFSVFAYVCVIHSNKVKRLKTEPSKLVLLSFLANTSSNLCVYEQAIRLLADCFSLEISAGITRRD